MNIINIYTLYSGALDQVASYFVLAECIELGCSSFIWQTYVCIRIFLLLGFRTLVLKL